LLRDKNQTEKASLQGIWHLLQVPESVVLQQSGLDAFFFLRYINTLFKIFLHLSLIVVPVFVPLNSLGGNNAAHGVDGLDRLSWANVNSDHASFYWAHLLMTFFVIWYVCYIVYKELLFYVEVRNCFLASPEHEHLESATTILVTDIPDENLHTLRELYSIFPGGVRSIKINGDISALSKKILRRQKLICAYEAAVIKSMKSATYSCSQRYIDNYSSSRNMAVMEKPSSDNVLPDRIRTESRRSWKSPIPSRLVIHDVKDQCLQELAKLNEDVRTDQHKLMELYYTGEPSTEFPKVRSAFVRFNAQSSAWMACQTNLCPRPLQLLARHVGVAFEDIRWDCLSFRWWNRFVRTGVVSVAIVSLLILWAVPVAFTGFLSQITTLADSVVWLAWLATTPPWLKGIIQGVLPQLILTLLTLVLPYILRIIADHQGHPTRTTIELSLQKYYFTFLFLQTFLIVSSSSSLTGIAQDVLHGLGSVPLLVAQNLPKSCNYFFSYLVIQGFSVSAATLLQAGGLFMWLLVSPLMDRTPRQKSERLESLPEVQWGTVFPLYTTFACIGRSSTTRIIPSSTYTSRLDVLGYGTSHTCTWRHCILSIWTCIPLPHPLCLSNPV